MRNQKKKDIWLKFTFDLLLLFSQLSMASYSFSSPGYVNIPPYYNTAPNGYSGLNFQYPLPERKMMISIADKLAFFFLQHIQQQVVHQLVF